MKKNPASWLSLVLPALMLSKNPFLYALIGLCSLLISACDDREQQIQQLLLKGNLALDHQQFEQAVRYYEEAVKLDPCFGDALNNIGTARFRGGRIDEAIVWYDKAISCSPRYDFLLNRANAHFENKAFFSAAEDAKRLLQLAPDSIDVLTLKGLIMSRLGRYDSALIWFDRVVENNPEAAESWVNRGTLNYYRKDFDVASRDLRKALQLDPTHAAALNARSIDRLV